MHNGTRVLLPYSEGSDPFIESVHGFDSRLFIERATGHMTFEPKPPKSVLRDFYDLDLAEVVPMPGIDSLLNTGVVEVCRGVLSYASDMGGMVAKPSVHVLGCGLGEAVWGFQQLDLSATGSDEILRSWVKAGNKTLNGALSTKPLAEALSRRKDPIDFFFSSHTLNLISDPQSALTAMSEHLSPRGVAYINVPNGWSDRIATIGRRSGDDYNFPIQLHFFTPRSLQYQLAEAGLEIVHIESRPLNELSPFQIAGHPQLVPHETLPFGELHVLAARPTNRRAHRDGGIDASIDLAQTRFEEIRRSGSKNRHAE